MNKFDIEYNKILQKQNLINQQQLINQISMDDVKKGLSKAWDSVTSIGNSISKAIQKGVTWSANKIKLALQKLYNFITPNNAQQTAKRYKSLMKIMPDSVSKQTNKAIEILKSNQFNNYISKEITNNYKSIDTFKQISPEEQKKFIDTTINTYFKQNDIISQQVITASVGLGGAIIWLLVKGLCYLILVGGGSIAAYFGITKILKDTGVMKKTEAEIAKDKAAADKINRENDRKNEEHQKWKTDQQRKKLFQQIINVDAFR